MTRRDRDDYPTPHSIIDAMLRFDRLGELLYRQGRLGWTSGHIWEPCAGDGRLVDVMRQRGCEVVAHDIVTGNDFFDWTEAQAPTIITNPPFSRIRDFIDHAFAIGVEKMALVCPERLWACGKGRAQWRRHRPSRFANLSWREDYLRKGGSPDRALAISIWDTPHAERCVYEIWGRA